MKERAGMFKRKNAPVWGIAYRALSAEDLAQCDAVRGMKKHPPQVMGPEGCPLDRCLNRGSAAQGGDG